MEDLFEIRLRVSDPAGYPIIVDGAIGNDEQTAYRVSESKYFNSDNERLEIVVSDSRIQSWISTYGINKSEIYALKAIIANLGAQIQIESDTSGAESTKFVSLSSRYKYLKGMLDDLEIEYNKNNKSSRVGTSIQPIIAGGYV